MNTVVKKKAERNMGVVGVRVQGLRSEYILELGRRQPAIAAPPQQSPVQEAVRRKSLITKIIAVFGSVGRSFRALNRARIDEQKLENRDPRLEVYRYRVGKDLL